jgi:hypothetical protein
MGVGANKAANFGLDDHGFMVLMLVDLTQYYRLKPLGF